jgi:regulatory protein
VKITSIKQQAKRSDRYSIFVEGKYSFSLSEGALIENKLASGQELSSEQVKDFKRLSTDDKLYHQALRYVAIRPRTEWDISFYPGGDCQKASSDQVPGRPEAHAISGPPGL